MSVKQLSVFAENKPGAVAEIIDVLVGEGIDIRAMNVADTQDFGILRLIVSDAEKAKGALANGGCVVSVTDVICVEMPDKPGALGNIIHLLARHHVNIEYMYAFIAVSGQHAFVVFRVNDNAKTEELFTSNGVRLVSEEELHTL